MLDGRQHGQVLVLDGDRVDGRESRRVRLGRDRGDRLAVEADLVDRDDRPVLDRVAEVRVDVVEVGAGEHADHAGYLLGCGGADRADACVRDRAAEDTAVEHSRDEQVADELCLTAHLLVGVEPGVRTADLRLDADRLRHATPASSATASMMPR